MTARIALALLALVVVAACSRHPLATRLPTGPDEVASVQAQLDQLPARDRELVLQYVARAKGTVLPPDLADPDAPLTARTFGEAIQLQRDFNARFAAEAEAGAQRRAAREGALEPLREAVEIELVARELVAAERAGGRQRAPGRAIDNKPVLVNTFRLHNHAAETVTRVSGSVTVRAASDPASLAGLSSCYIDWDRPIAAGATAEVRSANPRARAGARSEEYVAMPEDALVLTWEPRSVAFAGGRVLQP